MFMGLYQIGHPLSQNVSFDPHISTGTRFSHYKPNIYYFTHTTIHHLYLIIYQKSTVCLFTIKQLRVLSQLSLVFIKNSLRIFNAT